MSWEIEFYRGVEEDILNLPTKIQARMIRLLELMEVHGANLGSPHTMRWAMDYLRSARKRKKGLDEGYFVISKGNTFMC